MSPSAPAGAPAATPSEAPAQPASPIQIALREKRDCIIPGKHGDGLAEGGKITVETPEPNTLKATLIGVAAAHCFVGCHSSAVQTFQLVQEFDITSNDSNVTQASVALVSSLNGYVRSHHKGSAYLRVASVTITPAGQGRAALAATFPPASACGTGGQMLYQQEIKAPESRLLPLGRYVLEAHMVLEATADGVVNGRGVADFSSDPLPDGWKQEHDPFKDQDRKDFGFTIQLTTESPGTQPAASAHQNSRRDARIARNASTSAVAARP